MTIEEKLERFRSLCVTNTEENSEKMLQEYEASLREMLEEHKVDVRRQLEMQVSGEFEKIQRDINKKLSIEQINLKREYNKKQEELHMQLFGELRKKLQAFTASAAYPLFLESLVKKAMDFAGDAELVIYFDPTDEDKRNAIMASTGADIRLSDEPMIGGMQAEIPSKNILINHSLQSKLEEAESTFQFRLGGR